MVASDLLHSTFRRPYRSACIELKTYKSYFLKHKTKVMNLKIQILLVAILGLCVSELHAQVPPDFNAKKAAGLITYELDEVITKLKIKELDSQIEIGKALKVYNTKVDELVFANAATFQQLEDEFDRNVQIAMQRRDRSQMDGVKAKIQQLIPPIRKQILAEEQVLNEMMAGILTEKQNKKWLKYQSQKKGNYK
jgi:hypothetical protein